MNPEVWISLFPQPARVAGYAEMVERDGWDGLAVTDSQNNNGDAFIALTLAALATKRIKLTTAATNPYTRQPATVASAVATVHAVSGGRAVLGIGRGDSSVRTLGQQPVSLSYFRQALVQIQAYLSGGTVDLDGVESRMPWVQNLDLPKVPMSVSATGPKVIEIGAQVADRVTFSLGGEMSRLRWAVDLARTAREKAGLDPAGLSLGSYVVAVVEPDVAKARDIARSRMGIYAQIMPTSRLRMGMPWAYQPMHGREETCSESVGVDPALRAPSTRARSARRRSRRARAAHRCGAQDAHALGARAGSAARADS